MQHATAGRILAYDGYDNALMIDGPNVPSLISLGYLGAMPLSDPLYQRTRSFALNTDNPYFVNGSTAEGIWPMSIILRAFTAQNDREIIQCLRWLRDITADTNFIHEPFNKDNPPDFTRPWFAWANTMFGELILSLVQKRSQILREI